MFWIVAAVVAVAGVFLVVLFRGRRRKPLSMRVDNLNDEPLFSRGSYRQESAGRPPPKQEVEFAEEADAEKKKPVVINRHLAFGAPRSEPLPDKWMVLLEGLDKNTSEDEMPTRAAVFDGSLAALKVAAGRLLYQIPKTMLLRKTTMVEVRVGDEQSATNIAHGFVGLTAPAEEKIVVVQRMSVTLRGEEDAFQIDGKSEHLQFIGTPKGASGEFLAQSFGRWLFHVKPLQLGKRELYVTVSGQFPSENGSAHKALPERTFEVQVNVSAQTIFLGMAAQVWALIGVIFAGMVGAATSELWWPHLREMLKHAHLLP